MATSGTSTFELNRNEIIRAAARKIGAVRSNATMGSGMIADFAQALNAMVKHWQAEGLHVWTVSEATLFPQPGQTKYPISNATSSSHCTADYVQTEISAGEAAGQTVLSVESTAGILNADNIGVTLDDGSIHWTTVSGAPGATVTIASALPDSASEGNLVYVYTNKIVRPLRIVDGRRLDPVSLEESTVEMVARKDYWQLANKSATGQLNQAFYDPQLNVGQLYLYQTTTVAGDLFRFTYWRPIEDFNAAGDNPDLPQEWIQTLIFNLAVVMAPEFDVPSEKLQQIVTMAATFKDNMMGWDREAESFEFSPDFEG